MLRPSHNPTTEAMRGKEFELSSLPIGSRFRCGPITGTLTDITAGRCVVRMTGRSQRIQIHTADSGDVEFYGTRSRVTSLPHECPVIPLGADTADTTDTADPSSDPQNSTNGDDDMKQSRTSTSKPKKTAKLQKPARATTLKKGANPSNTSTPVSNGPAPTEAPTPVTPVAAAAPILDAKSKAIVARWKLAVTKLGDLLKVDTSSDVVNTQRERITNIYGEAVAAQILLPSDPVTFADPVFTDMEFATGMGASGGATGASAATTPAPSSKAKDGATGRKDGAPKKAAKTSKGANGAAKKPQVPKAPKADPSNPCLDGCGEKVRGRFKQGHDAKYRSMILAVEREEMAQDKLPTLMRQSGGVDGAVLEFKKMKEGYKCLNSVLAH